MFTQRSRDTITLTWKTRNFRHFTSEHCKVSKSEVFEKVIPAANFWICWWHVPKIVKIGGYMLRTFFETQCTTAGEGIIRYEHIEATCWIAPWLLIYVWTKLNSCQLTAFEMWVWHRMLRISWTEWKTNTWIRVKIGIPEEKGILEQIKHRKLSKYCYW